MSDIRSNQSAFLSDHELLRYSRHLLLPEFGVQSQMCWRASRVSIIGCGGLGHPVALYLASSGVGHIHLVDADIIDISNLQRQIVFRTADIGLFKVEVLAAALRALNTNIQVTMNVDDVGEEMTSDMLDLLAQSDLLLDCSDNFMTRYYMNNLSLQLNIPLISAAATGFNGMAGVFNLEKGAACYGCLFPIEDKPEDRQSCAEAGVFAPLLGVVGSYQANLSLKVLMRHLIDQKEAHSSFFWQDLEQVMTWDLLRGKTRQSRLKRDPNCRVCS